MQVVKVLTSTLLSDHCNKLLQIITSYTETGLALFYVAVEKTVKWKDKFSLSLNPYMLFICHAFTVWPLPVWAWANCSLITVYTKF